MHFFVFLSFHNGIGVEMKETKEKQNGGLNKNGGQKKRKSVQFRNTDRVLNEEDSWFDLLGIVKMKNRNLLSSSLANRSSVPRIICCLRSDCKMNCSSNAGDDDAKNSDLVPCKLCECTTYLAEDTAAEDDRDAADKGSENEEPLQDVDSFSLWARPSSLASISGDVASMWETDIVLRKSEKCPKGVDSGLEKNDFQAVDGAVHKTSRELLTPESNNDEVEILNSTSGMFKLHGSASKENLTPTITNENVWTPHSASKELRAPTSSSAVYLNVDYEKPTKRWTSTTDATGASFLEPGSRFSYTKWVSENKHHSKSDTKKASASSWNQTVNSEQDPVDEATAQDASKTVASGSGSRAENSAAASLSKPGVSYVPVKRENGKPMEDECVPVYNKLNPEQLEFYGLDEEEFFYDEGSKEYLNVYNKLTEEQMKLYGIRRRDGAPSTLSFVAGVNSGKPLVVVASKNASEVDKISEGKLLLKSNMEACEMKEDRQTKEIYIPLYNKLNPDQLCYYGLDDEEFFFDEGSKEYLTVFNQPTREQMKLYGIRRKVKIMNGCVCQSSARSCADLMSKIQPCSNQSSEEDCSEARTVEEQITGLCCSDEVGDDEWVEITVVDTRIEDQGIDQGRSRQKNEKIGMKVRKNEDDRKSGGDLPWRIPKQTPMEIAKGHFSTVGQQEWPNDEDEVCKKSDDTLSVHADGRKNGDDLPWRISKPKAAEIGHERDRCCWKQTEKLCVSLRQRLLEVKKENELRKETGRKCHPASKKRIEDNIQNQKSTEEVEQCLRTDGEYRGKSIMEILEEKLGSSRKTSCWENPARVNFIEIELNTFEF